MSNAQGTTRLLLLLACLSAVTPAVAKDVPDEYWLGLVDCYGIEKAYPPEGHPGDEPRFALVLWRSSTILPDVRTCGVSGRIIFGESKSGWYVLPVPHGRHALDDLLTFEDQQAWRAKLAELRVSGPPRPVEPDVLATTRPFRELKPAQCFRFRGALGMTDDEWIAVAILALLVGALTLNIARPTGKTLLFTTLLMGGLAFVLAWHIPWDQGLAPFSMPLAVLIFGLIGQIIRKLTSALPGLPSAVRGLPSVVGGLPSVVRRRFSGPSTKELIEFVVAPPARIDDEGMREEGEGTDDGEAANMNEPVEPTPRGGDQDGAEATGERE